MLFLAFPALPRPARPAVAPAPARVPLGIGWSTTPCPSLPPRLHVSFACEESVSSLPPTPTLPCAPSSRCSFSLSPTFRTCTSLRLADSVVSGSGRQSRPLGPSLTPPCPLRRPSLRGSPSALASWLRSSEPASASFVSQPSGTLELAPMALGPSAHPARAHRVIVPLTLVTPTSRSPAQFQA